MSRLNATLMPLSMLLVSGGCMAGGDFPSLAPREVEKQSIGEPVRPEPIVPNDDRLRSALADHVGSARRSHADFEPAAAIAERAAAAAGSSGTDSWTQAQELVSRAEAARSGTSRALADLEQLALERSNLPTSPADQAELEAALEQVRRLANGQQERLDRLRAIISG